MMASVSKGRGLGVAAGLDVGLARELAAHCERLGYHSLWSNDEPAAGGLDTVAQFAAATAKVGVGVGGVAAAPVSAGPDRGGGRPPRDRSREAVARDRVNEASAVRATVPRLTAQQLQDLHGCLEEMDALAGVDVHAWEEPHRRFHRGLVTHAGDRLVRLVEQLSDHAERYRRAYIAGDPRAWSAGAAEHRAIYEAAQSGDANGAAEATVQHLARTALTVLANLAPAHDPSLVRGAMRAGLAPDQPARSPRRSTSS